KSLGIYLASGPTASWLVVGLGGTIISLAIAAVIYQMFSEHKTKSRKSQLQFESTPDIIVCIPASTFTDQERITIVKHIKKTSEKLAETVEVAFFEDTQNEIENIRCVSAIAKEKGAKMVVPVRPDISMEGLIEELEGGFLELVSRDLFKVLNPDLAMLEDTHTMLMDSSRVRVLQERLTKVLPPIVSRNLATLSVFSMNTRMTNITRNMTNSLKLTEVTSKHIKSNQEEVISIGVNSLGEVKMLAETHRDMIEKHRGATFGKLQIRLTVHKGEESKINESTKQRLLKRMEIDDILSVNDLVLVSEEEAKRLTLSEIYEKYLKTNGYDKERIAIADSLRKYRTLTPDDKKLLNSVLFMEYEGIATPHAYYVLLELKAHKHTENMKEFNIQQSNKVLLHFILPRIKGINTEQIRGEYRRYSEIAVAA
ncbi:MAG: hypothetical protein KAU58_00130, partial [Candidatus Omnitrophica bacterium]|nr:hypothetical protein [Candidatus Omnitrophota bacterium]